ncbi:ATP synthase subunit a [Bacteroidales bacterium]|nr:ATP synthase subunit a [Bacteroidales bacterium]
MLESKFKRHNIFRPLIFLLLFFLPAICIQANTGSTEADGEKPIVLKDIIFSHVTDAYDWHLFSTSDHHYSIPLPIIVKSADRGWFIFSSSKVSHGDTYQGFRLATDDPYKGKLVEISTANATEYHRPLDLSFTKTAAEIALTSIALVLLLLSMAKSYKKDSLKSRRGFVGTIEMLIIYIYDDVIKPCVGPDYKKFAPYLLTAFFFIFFNNLLGLVPFFPGGANVTGNISVTFVLAFCTFSITNLMGTKEYYKEIFWPDVPLWLKVPIPVMPFIEVLGAFTKAFALMIRLFANMLAGHMILLVLTSLIFVFYAIGGPLVASGVSLVSILFSIFMLVIDVLVSFIQAYVFTMLSSIFIGMARVHHSH